MKVLSFWISIEKYNKRLIPMNKMTLKLKKKKQGIPPKFLLVHQCTRAKGKDNHLQQCRFREAFG